MVSEGTAPPGISSVVTRTAFKRHARELVHRADAFDLRINFWREPRARGASVRPLAGCIVRPTPEQLPATMRPCGRGSKYSPRRDNAGNKIMRAFGAG